MWTPWKKSASTKEEPMVPAEQLRAAVEHDIEVILKACMPDDFFVPGPEPKVVGMCLHPYQKMTYVDMLRSDGIKCQDCGTVLTENQVQERLVEWKQTREQGGR